MKRIECSICTRNMPLSSFPILSAKCEHPRETCRKCWNDWLKAQIDTIRAEKIKCVQCPRILDQSDIKRLARPAAYETYLDSQLKASLSANPDFHWCITPDCGSGQMSSGNIFTCIQCEVKTCIHCASAWHEGETCGAYQARIAHRGPEERASELEVSRISKMCPGCEMKIEKINGCDHMTCNQCLHQFCWLCLADYKDIFQNGNSEHKTTCAHYRANRIIDILDEPLDEL